ncbi:actin binding Rho activating protein b [Platichthys flesus]|uniref:actin binding Rho activating protein b n=1 Tax=Platichthys flesus TaxID=8260 RepID=UPI002DBE829F|nr:actin binding Rho activating protein b [Platichthys flesus]
MRVECPVYLQLQALQSVMKHECVGGKSDGSLRSKYSVKPDTQRNPSANKNIKKQWVMDNEDKQVGEPSGWAPSTLGGPTEEPRKTWVPRTPAAAQIQPTEGSQVNAPSSGEAQKTSAPQKKIEEPPVTSAIKTKQVVTKKITREALPSAEEIDRLLAKKRSPTLRRRCSNMVSSLTKSWKKVEKEQKFGEKGARAAKSQTGGLDKEECGYREKEDDAQTHTGNTLKESEEKDGEGDFETWVKIKRPSVPKYKNEAEDANKINALSKKYSAVGILKSRWQSWASDHTVTQRLNPFSENFDHDYSMSLRLQKGEEGYGRPKEGTKTAERAKRAEQHIHREIADMCFVIRTMADPDPDGKTRITFGELFDRYVRISDKVVGILMRARKHGKVAFDGEMLWQGQDDGVIITLLV